MNHGTNILFRAIPLFMGAFCFAFGAYVFASGHDVARLTAGPVVFFLGAICVALYCTAATVTRRIAGNFNETAKYIFPILGYSCALVTLICGILILASDMPGGFVTGHAVCGFGFITACVSTVATASARFSLIRENSADETFAVNPAGFSRGQASALIYVVSAVAAAMWMWCLVVFVVGRSAEHVVSGCVLFGIACVCTSLTALVACIARQIRGTYTLFEGKKWITLVLVMGALSFIFGLIMIFACIGKPINFAGFVLIGFALICWSISSKVILLTRLWHADFPQVSRIPIIPILSALTCLFMAAFLFEAATFDTKYFVAARMVTGFGAICFTLYSIAAILDSGEKR